MNDIVKSTNCWQRIALLLRMEWASQKRNMLIISGVLLLVSVVLTELIGGVNFDRNFDSPDVQFLSGMVWLGIFFSLLCVFAFWATHKRLNHSDTITYTLVPSATGEKMTVLLIEYLLVVPWAMLLTIVYILIMQVLHPSLGFINWLNPNTTILLDFNNSSFIEVKIRNLILFTQLSSLLFSLALAMLVSIRFRSFISAFFAYIGINVVAGIGSSAFWVSSIMMSLEQHVDKDISEEQLQSILFGNIPWYSMALSYPVLAIICFVIAYRSLKKRQLI